MLSWTLDLLHSRDSLHPYPQRKSSKINECFRIAFTPSHHPKTWSPEEHEEKLPSVQRQSTLKSADAGQHRRWLFPPRLAHLPSVVNVLLSDWPLWLCCWTIGRKCMIVFMLTNAVENQALPLLVIHSDTHDLQLAFWGPLWMARVSVTLCISLHPKGSSGSRD